MDSLEFATQLDLLYEAAVVPALWPAALARVAASVDAALGSLVTVPFELGIVNSSSIRPQMQWVGTPDGERLITDFAALADSGITNERVTRASQLRHPGFFSDLDLFAPEELADQRFYRDFLWPRGYGWCAATVIEAPTGDSVIASVERQRTRGPYERDAIDALDRLRPHLARAALLTLRLAHERARAAADALARIGLPAAVTGAGGHLLATNALLEALEPDVVQSTGGRLRLANRRADVLLELAIARVRKREYFGPEAVGSVAVPAQGVRPPMVVHVLPVCGAAHDVFQRGEAIVVVTRVEQRAVPGAEVLQGLFDLTPAEATIARLIGNGAVVADIAAARHISPLTVRAHVRAILAKTGTERQSDLIALLAGSSLPVAGPVPDEQ